MYVTTAASPTSVTLHSRRNTQEEEQERPVGAESRLRYIEKLLSNADLGLPQQKQVRMQQFETKMPQRQAKSASGYPAQKRMQK